MFSYLDAASGSTLVAVFASGAVGIGVMWKMFKSKLGFGRSNDVREAEAPAERPSS